jgi:hypothetical protein
MDHLKKHNTEYLGTVRINNSRDQAELRRAADPNGPTVVHAVRKQS